MRNSIKPLTQYCGIRVSFKLCEYDKCILREGLKKDIRSSERLQLQKWNLVEKSQNGIGSCTKCTNQLPHNQLKHKETNSSAEGVPTIKARNILLNLKLKPGYLKTNDYYQETL